VVFSSVIHVDLREAAPARACCATTRGRIARLTPAIAAPVLDAAALLADPEYLPELARILAAAIEDQKSK